MTLSRALPSDFDAVTVEVIDGRLRALVRDQGIDIPLAIESGSRAWGFPSPDSDYDCRFIYVRSEDDYLSPWLPRDVIETPLDAVLDVSGWDLRKALQLVLRGNAVASEWLRSPIAYGVDEEFREAFVALCERVCERSAIGRHYQHLGIRQWQRHGGTREEGMPLKRLFYALRPALAVRWMRVHPDRVQPPVNIARLMDEADVGRGLRVAIDELIALKEMTREMGSGLVPAAIGDLIESELAGAEELFAPTGERDLAAAESDAAEFFRWAVRRPPAYDVALNPLTE